MFTVEGPGTGERENELAVLLADLGLDVKPARVVAFLAAHGSARSTDLERACGLRQPEVSQATKKLREEYRWIVSEPHKSKGKGRPVNQYSLQVPFSDIIGQLEAQKKALIEEDLRRLEKLRAVAAELHI